jgi:hypothetical protein
MFHGLIRSRCRRGNGGKEHVRVRLYSGQDRGYLAGFGITVVPHRNCEQLAYPNASSQRAILTVSYSTSLLDDKGLVEARCTGAWAGREQVRLKRIFTASTGGRPQAPEDAPPAM